MTQTAVFIFQIWRQNKKKERQPNTKNHSPQQPPLSLLLNNMSSAAVASPDPADANPAVAAIQSVQRRDDTTADIADPIELFAHDYDANDGRVASIHPPTSGDKRPASPRKKTAAAVSSPVKKRTNVTSSPARRAIGFVAAVGNSLSRAVDPPSSTIV